MDKVESKIQVEEEFTLNTEGTLNLLTWERSWEKWIEIYLKTCDWCGVKSYVMFSILLM